MSAPAAAALRSCQRVADASSGQTYYVYVTWHPAADGAPEASTFDLAVTDGRLGWRGAGGRRQRGGLCCWAGSTARAAAAANPRLRWGAGLSASNVRGAVPAKMEHVLAALSDLAATGAAYTHHLAPEALDLVRARWPTCAMARNLVRLGLGGGAG